MNVNKRAKFCEKVAVKASWRSDLNEDMKEGEWRRASVDSEARACQMEKTEKGRGSGTDEPGVLESWLSSWTSVGQKKEGKGEIFQQKHPSVTGGFD